MTHPIPQLAAGAGRLLVADDQRDILESLRLLFKSAGYDVHCVQSTWALQAALREHQFDLLLLDLNYTRDTTSGSEGLELLRQIREEDPSLPVIVMTAWGSIELAVRAMQGGAGDFIQKPWENQRVLATVRSQVELGRALRHTQRLTDENQRLRADYPTASELIAVSPAMQKVGELIARVAPSDASVLILGEHGTGKEVAARALHTASARTGRPMITVNTGAIPDNLFESELFGHAKGAFTDARNDRTGRFEMADGGTIFLDEIANVPLSQQSKLLRVLQSGEFERVGSSRTYQTNVRIISATNADLHAEAAAGRFRQDLLYRLNTIELRLPPLRERREDITPLAQHFLLVFASRYRRPVNTIAPEAVRELLHYPWPGNVRELEHVIERAVLMSAGERLLARDLGLGTVTQDGADLSKTLDSLTLEEVEQLLVRKAMDRHQGNVSRAARSLGLSRAALYRRLQR